MPKVTHIITGLNVGGAERALHNLLTGGLQDRFDNSVISLTDEGHYGPLLRSAGVPVTCLNMVPGRPTVSAVLRLRRALLASAPDILQGWMYHANLAASLGRRLAAGSAATVWNIRMSLERGRQLKVSTEGAIRIGAWLSHAPSAIIYNAARSREQHERQGYAAARGTIFPNGFDVERWRPDPSSRERLRQMLNLPSQTLLIGFVGRADPLKDLPNLLSAFNMAAAAHPDVRLVCVGRDLRNFVGDSDAERVLFLGQRGDVERVMPGFDLLCLSSSSEGFPNVIGEAMACGVPCVATDVGDAAAIVGDTGWVAPPRDSRALNHALGLALAATPLERRERGAAARARIETHYSLGAMVEQYRALYERLAGVA